MRKAKLLLSVFLLLAWHNFLYAQGPQPIGSITFIEGVSDIVRNNQEPVITSENEPLYINDHIRTKSYSKIEITFIDKSVLKLAPDSYVTIEEYRVDDKKRREHSRIKLARGRIEAIVSKTGTPDTFLLETPNTQGAVKGSDIFLSYLGGKTGVFVQEGAISLFNPAVPGIKIKVAKDNCVVVPFSEAPGEIRPTRDAEIAYFKSGVEPAFIKKWIPAKGATEMNGVIVSLAGSLRIYKKGADNWREPKLSDTVSEGDKIQTEENSTIEIRMSNGNTVVLQPYTELSFTTLRYDPASGNYENTLAITKGRLSAVVARTNKQLTFQVQTPTSVCGVRGTFMEVVVNPPAAAQGAPVGEPAQPTTQVFFEGGSGFVTSVLTGQTQEIGSGQNAIVDALGNVAAPEYTAPEQRSAMFQVWTSAQTMNSYSTAEGATGVGSNTQQQPLPQPPVGPILPPILTDFVDNPPDIGDPWFKEPLVLTIYDQNIPFQSAGATGYEGMITMDCFRLTILGDQTWSGITSGTWSGYIPDSWWASFDTGTGDHLSFDVTSPDHTWSGTISGDIHSTSPNIAIDGTISGTATGETAGTFEGAASGTWVPVLD